MQSSVNAPQLLRHRSEENKKEIKFKVMMPNHFMEPVEKFKIFILPACGRQIGAASVRALFRLAEG